jgi:hypothetical protein
MARSFTEHVYSSARPIGRATRQLLRRGLRLSGWMVVRTLAIGFILCDADWWALRDWGEHIRAALLGTYIKPECRSDPENCGRKPPPVTPPRMVCSNRPGL